MIDLSGSVAKLVRNMTARNPIYDLMMLPPHQLRMRQRKSRSAKPRKAMPGYDRYRTAKGWKPMTVPQSQHNR